jgi:FlaA1/EpsC-like NDP-sugar epimerase
LNVTFFRHHRGLISLCLSIIHDLIVAAAAFLLSYATILGLDEWSRTPGIYDKTLGFIIFVAVMNSIFGTSRGSWRYVSIPDFLNIIKSSTASVILYTLAAFFVSRAENVPRSVPIITLLYLIAGLCASRLTYRLFHEYRAKLSSRYDLTRTRMTRNVLLLGVSDVAESFIRATRRDSNASFNVVGILDDARKNHGRLIQGIKVLGSLYEVKAIADGFGKSKSAPMELVIAETTPNRKRLGQIVELATTANLKVLRIPNFSETH